MYIQGGIAMETVLKKWGNSQGIRLPKNLLNELKWKNGDKLSLTIKNNKIVIEPQQKHKTIKELFKDYEGDYVKEEIDWGEPVGKEIW